MYSGEQFDSKIGQQYLRQRYYDPVTGRFNRFDPFFGNLSDPQSLHNYLYCHADPISYTDPSGELVPILILALKLTGAFVGGYAVGAGLSGFLSHWLNGSSLYASATNGLAGMAYPITTVAVVAATPFTLVFATLTSFWDLRAAWNKWYYVGNGGKDATSELLQLRNSVIKHWNLLTTDEKTTVMRQLHTPGLNLTNWDISQLVENKDAWTDGIPAPM